MQKPDFKETLSTSLVGGTFVPSNSLVEDTLRVCADVVDPRWVKRHAKLIYKIGAQRYLDMADIARKRGRNPIAYMAKLVTRELNEGKDNA